MRIKNDWSNAELWLVEGYPASVSMFSQLERLPGLNSHTIGNSINTANTVAAKVTFKVQFLAEKMSLQKVMILVKPSHQWP